MDSPSDEQVGKLFCEATVFIQTSTHEGFALPPLEAMACGTPVVCTDANGNRDFCVDGVNCLMPPATPRAVSDALARLLADAELRASLGAGGDPARPSDYAWERRIDALEDFFRAVAGARRMALGGRGAGAYRSSAMRGASRLKYQKPSTNVRTRSPTGASSHSQLPITWPALQMSRC